MRLTNSELDIIRKTFHHYFDAEDHLWLFGSRVDDTKRGGDIDFYIETIEQNTKQAILKKIDFIVALRELLGDQKIDIVLNQLSLKDNLLVYQIARETGVKLI